MRLLHVVQGSATNDDEWCGIRGRRVATTLVELGFEPLLVSTEAEGTTEPLGLDGVRHQVLELIPAGPSWLRSGQRFNQLRHRLRKLAAREHVDAFHVVGAVPTALAALTAARQVEVPVVAELFVPETDVWGWLLSAFDGVVTPSREQHNAWRRKTSVDVTYIPDGIDLNQDPPGFGDGNFACVVAPFVDAQPDLAWWSEVLTLRPELRRRCTWWVPRSVSDPDVERLELNPEKLRWYEPNLEGLHFALRNSTCLLYLCPAPRGTPVEVLASAGEARPVIGPDSPSLRELIRDEATGWLVPIADGLKTLAAIDAAEARAESSGQALYTDAVRSREWRVLAEGYFEVFDDAAIRRRRGGTLGRATDQWQRWLDASRRGTPSR